MMQWVYVKIGLGVLLMGVSFVWLLSCIQASDRANDRIASEYHQAPYCTPTSSPASGLEPCSYEPVRVVQEQKITTKLGNAFTSGEKRSDLYALVLTSGRGHMTQVRISRRLFHAVAPGSDLTAQVWRSKIRFVSYQNRWYQTQWNPERQSGNNSSWVVLLIVAEIYAVLSLAVYWDRQRKMLRNGPAQTESNYPLVKDDN